MASKKTKKELKAQVAELHRRLFVLSCQPDSNEAMMIKFGYIKQQEIEAALWSGSVKSEPPSFKGFVRTDTATASTIKRS